MNCVGATFFVGRYQSPVLGACNFCKLQQRNKHIKITRGKIARCSPFVDQQPPPPPLPFSAAVDACYLCRPLLIVQVK